MRRESFPAARQATLQRLHFFGSPFDRLAPAVGILQGQVLVHVLCDAMRTGHRFRQRAGQIQRRIGRPVQAARNVGKFFDGRGGQVVNECRHQGLPSNSLLQAALRRDERDGLQTCDAIPSNHQDQEPGRERQRQPNYFVPGKWMNLP